MEIGERFSKYTLDNDSIDDNFDDDLSDVSFFQKARLEHFYKFNLQPKLMVYNKHIGQLKKNSDKRIKINKAYTAFLKEIKKKDNQEIEFYNFNDLQLIETINIIKDLILILEQKTS